MTRHILLSVILIAFIISCNEHSAPKEIKKDSIIVKANIELVQCYSRIIKRDTITLQLKTTDSIVTGTMNYRIYEKDQNKGDIKGIIKGDTIIADYTFLSEGRTSVRQIALLKKGQNLVEGIGDMVDNNGKMEFKPKEKLVFSDNMILKPTACK